MGAPVSAVDKPGTYVVPNVVIELRHAAAERFGWSNTTEVLESGKTELRVEYRAAILLDRQADRIAMLEATLRSVTLEDSILAATRLADGALDYDPAGVPEAISTEDGDPAWVAVTPITQTKQQVIAALKVNGMWEEEPTYPGKVDEHGYEVEGKVWCVPAISQTERMLLTQADLDAAHADPLIDEESILWYEMPEHEGCETGAWWWRCTATTFERDATEADCTCAGPMVNTHVDGNGGHSPGCPARGIAA